MIYIYIYIIVIINNLIFVLHTIDYNYLTKALSNFKGSLFK